MSKIPFLSHETPFFAIEISNAQNFEFDNQRSGERRNERGAANITRTANSATFSTQYALSFSCIRSVRVATILLVNLLKIGQNAENNKRQMRINRKTS